MKRLLIIHLALLVLFGLVVVSCSGSEDDSNKGGDYDRTDRTDLQDMESSESEVYDEDTTEVDADMEEDGVDVESDFEDAIESEISDEEGEEDVVPLECLEGQERCLDNSVQVCTNGRWEVIYDCSDESPCQESDGRAICASACVYQPCEYNGDKNRNVCEPSTEPPYYVCNCNEGTHLVSGGDSEPAELCLPDSEDCAADKVIDLGEFSGDTITASGDTCSATAFIVQGLGRDRCTGFENPGPERVYSVSIPAGVPALIRAIPKDSNFDLSLYTIDSCQNIAPCNVGSDSSGPGGEELISIASSDSAQQIMFVVDSAFADDSEPANDSFCGEFDIEITTPAPCSIESSSLPLHVSSSTDGGESNIAPSIGNRTYTGADKLYAIELSAGDRLHATLESSVDLDLYLLPQFTCMVAGPVPNVLAFSRNSGTGNEELYFTAPNDGTYVLVLDAIEGVSGSFVLDAQIVPQQTDCEGVVHIDSLPFSIEDTTITEDDSVFMSGCNYVQYHGRDMMFALDTQAGSIYHIRVEPFSSSRDLVVYLLRSCADQQEDSPTPECVAIADDQGPGGAESLTYVASSSSVVYIVVDTLSAVGEDEGGLFEFSVEKL